MDKPRTTPKDFFLWAGAMVAFYWSVTSFLGLIFDYINFAFPVAPGSDYYNSYYYANPYQSGISYEMASLVVLFPLFIILMRVIHADIAKDSSRSEIWVRRWAIFLTLFVAGATMAGDLIWLLTSFLNGEDLTLQFLSKAGITFLVAAAIFMHFWAEFKGYWAQFPARAHAIGYAAAVLVLITIVSGFFIVGTPGEARQMRYDSDKVNDLMTIQSEIVEYWRNKEEIPASLTDLNDSVYSFQVPVDTQTGAAYEYNKTGTLSFELCATFNAADRTDTEYPGINPSIAKAPVYITESTDWSHGAGHECFDRTIDPERIKPYPKPQQ